MTVICENSTITETPVVWTPAEEAGVLNESDDALVLEIDDVDQVGLLEDLNAVVYVDGRWKITYYDRKETQLIAKGQEENSTAAQICAEDWLEQIWEALGRGKKKIFVV